MMTRLELRNFTAFADLGIDFSPKINVIIGENGTGKTHLLKAAYALCWCGYVYKIQSKDDKYNLASKLTDKLLRLFMPLDGKLGKMWHHGAAENAKVEARFAQDEKIVVGSKPKSRSLKLEYHADYPIYKSGPVFLPTKEVLSLLREPQKKIDPAILGKSSA